MNRWLVASGLAVALCLGLAARPSAAQDAPKEEIGNLAGTWKLMLLPFNDDVFAVLKVSPHGADYKVEVLENQSMVGQVTPGKFSQTGDEVRFEVTLGAIPVNDFRGRWVKAGPNAGKILGTAEFRGERIPMRFERGPQGSLNEIKGPDEYLKAVMSLPQTETFQKTLEELIQKNPGNPRSYHAYVRWLDAARVAKSSAENVEKKLAEMGESAREYGAEFVVELRLKALRALANSKEYAGVSLKLARTTLEEHTSAMSVNAKAALTQIVLTAAKAAGDEALVKKASEELESLQTALDEEYLKTFKLPFEIVKYPGRDPKLDRVVLFELFTGAECPPCVAADVAFDGIVKSYSPQELVVLQYHLHIPRPDPLTNADSVARSEYYEVGGTPWIFFNGLADARAQGGGGIAASAGAYKNYQEVINELLQKPAPGKVQVQATRSGTKLEIRVQGEATADKDADIRLRVAVTEESVRHQGGNRLRFHHHVVRALAGGPDGKKLTEGKAEATYTIDLVELRKAQEKENAADYAGTAPPIPLEHLSVVAFLQRESDKHVLQAATAAVKE